MKIKITFFQLILLTVVSLAQTPNYLWEKKSLSAGSPDVFSTITKVDTLNSCVYNLGAFTDSTINFGSGNLAGPITSSEPIIFLNKYDLSGNLIWAKTFPTKKQNYPMGLCTDNSGNVLICGYTITDTLKFGTLSAVNANSPGYLGYITKFDASGNPVWLRSSGGAGGSDVQCNGIATDNSGNIYSTGFIYNAAGPFLGNSVVGGMYTMKLNSSGVSQWFLQSPDANFSYGNAVAIDHAGSCIVGGGFATDLKFGSFVLNAAGSLDVDQFTLKLNSSTGALIWANANGINNPNGNNRANKITVDAGNNIYISGQETHTAVATGTNVTSYYFIEKRNSLGVLQWHNSYTPRNSSNSSFADGFLATHESDQSGNVYGLFDVQDSMLIGSTYYQFNQNVPCLAKFNTAGAVSWVKKTMPMMHTIGSFTYYTGEIFSYGLALDKSGYIYQSGALGRDSVMFDSTPVSTVNSRREFYVSKLNNTVTSGINEIGKAELNYLVYPNPASEVFYIKSDAEIRTIQLIDNGGNILSETKEDHISVSGFPSGIYMMRIVGDSFVRTSKVIIMK